MMKLATPLPADHLLVERVEAHEALSELFRIDLEILHEEATQSDKPTYVDPKDLIGQPMAVSVLQSDAVSRFFNGICVDFAQGSRNERFTMYRAVLRPQAWLLTQRSQSRIFQQKSVPDVLKKVFDGLKVTYELQGTFESRNYCVQYRETDWDFASRLMEEEGIFYYFDHNEDDHTMVVANTPQSHPDIPNKAQIPYIMDVSSGAFSEELIDTWKVEHKLRTGQVTLFDSNFELPGKHLEANHISRFTIGGNNKLENYDYPGDYAKRFDGIDPGGGERESNLQKIFTDNQRTVTLRQQEIDVEYVTTFGTANFCSLIAGHKFELTRHPIAAYNGAYLVVAAKTVALQTPDYNTDQALDEKDYSVTFSCIPHGGQGGAPFRPARRTPKPIVHGSQTAFVVGPSGEEIFTDKYGRVKVQFQWDRHGKSDSDSSCWMRVAQSWAGKKWGTMFIPRIGMEVIVACLEGDPDQPIITGCVYNAESMPPYTLPDEKTKMTMKSYSTKGGGGFNEFRFEDKKGSEQIFIHAEKDQDIRVKNDCKELIIRDRHLIVERDQLEKIKRDKHLQVVGDHNEKIDGTMSIKVGADIHEKAGSNYALEAGTAVHIKGGTSVVVEAGSMLTLKVGGNFVNINSGGIFIKGTMVMLNSGGAAGSGAGCSPEAPKDPLEADNAEPGQNPNIPRSNPPIPASDFGPMAALLRSSAQSGAPFCDI